MRLLPSPWVSGRFLCAMNYRDTTKPWYGTARWKAKRKAQLAHEPICWMCEQLGITKTASIADHDPPHKGDKYIFWHGTLRSLCKHCHDSHKQSEERTGRRKRATGHDGWPID